MPAKGDDDRLVLDGEHRRSWRPGTRRQIGRRGPILPLGDRLLVDPVPPGQHPQALLTMLYRSTDRRSRAGASVEYLAHSASFHSTEKIAPSKPGTKHLGPKADHAQERKDQPASRRATRLWELHWQRWS